MAPQVHITDTLIVGTGIAGLTAAVLTAEHRQVTLLTKGALKESNTYLAQGGVAAVLGRDDDFESHIKDTLTAGRGHCHESAVRHLVENAPKAIRFLRSVGLDFNDDPALEAGHSHPRVWRTNDATGQAIFEALGRAVRKNASIQVLENAEALELITVQGACRGVFFRRGESDAVEALVAKNTVLATGGLGQLFKTTTNPLGAAGDGLVLALKAGLLLRDMEFIQFHPTAFAQAENGSHFLISETLRGAGARLLNSRHESFLHRYDPAAEMACRDTVARAIHFELLHGPVFLDARMIDSQVLKTQFPTILKTLRRHGLNLKRDLIPVVPAAHYACGGIPVDLHGATSLPNLFAVGEVAHTGVHGANRLASNSLLEALVFAHDVATTLERSLPLERTLTLSASFLPEPSTFLVEELGQVKAYAQRIRDVMSEHVGLLRTSESLFLARTEIESIPARDSRIQNRQRLCQAIIEACLARPKSLGAHFMGDVS